jgi:hypothetical protein
MSDAQKRDSKLFHFDELKEAVISNSVKNVPAVKKEKKHKANHSLSDFSS